jgi:hypothetical protein
MLCIGCNIRDLRQVAAAGWSASPGDRADRFSPLSEDRDDISAFQLQGRVAVIKITRSGEKCSRAAVIWTKNAKRRRIPVFECSGASWIASRTMARQGPWI